MAFSAHDAGRDAMRRARALAALSGGPAAGTGTEDDLLRVAWAMGVGALDTYLHRLITTRAYAGDMHKHLAEAEIPFEAIVAICDWVVERRSTGVNARPKVLAKKALREALLEKTFQSPRNVQKAIQMAGKSSPGSWGRLATSVIPGGTVNSFEKQLGQIVHRRNCIVHESDYRRLDRPRDPGTEPITLSELNEALDFLERVIDGIHAL